MLYNLLRRHVPDGAHYIRREIGRTLNELHTEPQINQLYHLEVFSKHNGSRHYILMDNFIIVQVFNSSYKLATYFLDVFDLRRWTQILIV